MNKLVSVSFHEHPIFKNLIVDFCDQSKRPVDTIIIAGENGAGKSTLLNCLYKIVSGSVDFEATVKLECDGRIVVLEYYSRNINGENHVWVKDSLGLDTLSGNKSFFVKYPLCGIFSDIDINFHSKDISSVTSLVLDSDSKSRRSNTDLPTQIKQLLIDIQAQDDSDLATAYRKNKEAKLSTDNLKIEERMPRFTKAFNSMFDNLTYSHVGNTGRSKSILFQKYGESIDLDALSSGEKQIVYRGCFLLKDVNAMNNAFVFIDEPEISLHPSWQTKVMDYYKGIFTNSENIQTSQIFTVTHSPFIIHSEHRSNDKVIVLFRNTDGTIGVKDKPEYYKCTSSEVVQDAFAISDFSAEKSFVYLEGRTDEKYFKKAAEVFGYNLPFEFKWVGYIDERGQEVNTGDKSIDRAFQFLVAQNLSTKYMPKGLRYRKSHRHQE